MRTGILLDRAGTVIASATQDVEPILKRNQRLRGEPQTSDWGRHVATIPNVILVKWLNEAHARGNTALRMFTKEFDELVERKLATRSGNTCAPIDSNIPSFPREAPRDASIAGTRCGNSERRTAVPHAEEPA